MEGEDDKLDRLKAEARELKQKEASVKAKLKKTKELREREERKWRLSTFMKHVVLISYALCNYQAPAATKYLTITGRKRKWPDRTEAELEELVETLFLECETEEFTELADQANPKDPAAFAVAVRYSEEWQMFVFVEDQNARLGLAPSTESLLDRWRQRAATYPEESRPRDPGLVTESKARKWAFKWRGKWGAKHGAIRVLDEIPAGEARGKAKPEPGDLKK